MDESAGRKGKVGPVYRMCIDHCDGGCPNGHYTRLIGSNPIDLHAY